MDFDYSKEIITPDIGDSITIGGTGSLIIPSGTSNQRPQSPTLGSIRYNSTTNGAEIYGGYTPGWTPLVGGSGGGGSFSGVLTFDLNANSYSIYNLKSGVNSGDAVNKSQLDAHIGDYTLHLTSAQNTWIDAITTTSTEVNYLSGVTSSIQTQINSKQPNLGFTAENVANKGIASGYAGLNASGTVPTTQLPALAYSVAGRTGTVTLTSADVGLGNVNNTSDANKPVSTAQAAINATLAPLSNPTFIGTVTATTFVGALTGNASTATNVSYSGLTGTIPTWNQNTTGTAANITGTYTGTISSTQVTTGLGFTPINSATLGTANGVATLDSAGKLTTDQIPTSLVGALQYQGLWNASTNSPTLVSGVGIKGQYYKVDTAGTIAVDSHTQWNIGDLIIFDGTVWDKVDGISSEVISVAGRTGTVVLTSADVGLGNVNNTSDLSKPISTATQLALDLKQNSLGFTAENVTNKGIASGYAGLDSSGTVPTTQLPALAYSVAGRTGTIVLTSSDVGLGNVNNTSDVNKPVSTATQTALDLKQNSLGFTAENVANKGVASGYAGLNASGTVPTTQLPALAYSVAGRTGTVTLTATDVGLGNVNNTSDLNKPVSTATQSALDLKQNSLGFTAENAANKGVASGYAGLNASGTVPTTQLPALAYSVAGRTGTVVLTSSDVGLGNVNNTSDVNKPVSTATQNALNLKQNSLGFTAENAANKGVASGYAGLDSNSLVPLAQLPITQWGVHTYSSVSAFPVTGNANNTYIDTSTEYAYYWNGTLYVQFSGGSGGGGTSGVSSINTRTGDITLTATDVGLGNVNNTSDLSKPVSTATQSALDLKQNSLGFTAENAANKGAINGYAGLNASGTVPTTQLPALAYSVAGRTGTVVLTSADVGLGNVNNTSDLSKPVSTATQSALDLKQNSLGFTAENAANKGVASGYAGLDSSGLVPLTQLPIAQWGVHTYSSSSGFPATGSINSVYIDTSTEYAYYWNGTLYVQFSGGAGGAGGAGGVNSVNTRTGDITLTAADVGLGNVNNTSDANKPISTATQTALNLKLNSSTYTAADILTKLLTVDGTGSTLDADTLDGIHASGFATSTHLHTGVYQPNSTDLAAIAALTGTGFAKRTGTGTWSIDTSTYITANQMISLSGDATGTGTTSISITLGNTGVLPGTYTKVTTDSKGRITFGTNLSTSDVTTALGYTPLSLVGGTMTGLLTLSGLPTNSLHAATKSYVDGLISGISWKSPILDPNLYSDAISTPPTPLADEVYIIGTNPTGAWSGLAGHAVYYDNTTSTWVDILNRPVAIGDRFGVVLEDGTLTPTNGLTGKSRNVAQITSATPGSIAYTFFAPVDNDALYVKNQLSSHFGNSYTYDSSAVTWVEFNSQVSILPGAGLDLVGNTLNIGTDSANRIVVNANSIDLASGIVSPGTYHSVTVDTYGRVTAGSSPTTISGYGITDAAPLSHVSDYNLHLTSAQNTWIDAITVTSTEVNYLSGVASNIQTQINSKQSNLGFTAENAANKGVASGYAGLDSSGLVPLTQLPIASWGVHTYSSVSAFPATGSINSTYIDTTTEYAYYWNGTIYVQFSGGSGGGGVGGVSSVNTRTGDITLTSTDVGLGNVNNTSDANKPVSTATQTALNLKLNSSNYTAADILTKLLTVDGTGSTLDADTLDGIHASGFATSTHLHTGVYQLTNADLTAIANLSGTTGYLEKLASGVWTLSSTGGGSTGGTITLAGDVSGSGTSTIVVTLNGNGVTAGTYNSATQINPFTVDSTGRLTSVESAIDLTPSWTNVTNKPTTLSGYGITDAIVANTPITAGTATKITYDVNGLVVSGTSLSASDIPDLDWSKITTGIPTTLAGYGITLSASDIPTLDWSKITSGKPTTLAGYGITNAIVANTPITAGTATKVTYDVNGLVVSGTSLSSSDIPTLDWSKITTGKPTTLSGYGITDAIVANTPITAGTATKVTYDTTGLVLSGTSLSSSDIPTLDWSKITTGKPTTLSGYGITDALTSNSNASVSGNIFSSGNISTLGNIFTVGTGNITSSRHVYDMVGDVRTATVQPISSNYTLQITDNGTCLVVTAGIIQIPVNIFSMGNNITIYNNSSTIISIDSSLLTAAYIAGVDVVKTTISIGPRGMCTILFYDHDMVVVSGYVQ